MKRALVVVAALAAALVVGLAAGTFWDAGNGTESTAAPSELVAVSATLDTPVHAFGDSVEATVDVLVDTREIDLSSIRPQPNFGPYEQVGAPHVQSAEHGALGRVRYEYHLVCLKEGCDAAEARGVSDFPSGRVRYTFKGRPGHAFAAFDWPLLEVVSRVADADVEQIRWRADESTLTAVSYRVSPLTAGLVLLVVAFVAAGAAVLLAWRLWWPRRTTEAETPDESPARSPLEQAFDVALREPDNGDAPERRRALERVACELGALGRPELADEARALAWSPNGSTPDQIARLARRVGVTSTAAGSR